MRIAKATTISILAAGMLAGATVGVTAQDEAAAEVTSFTGTLSFSEVLRESTDTDRGDGFTEYAGFSVLNSLESSDPRLTGDHRVVINSVGVPFWWEAPGGPSVVHTTLHELTNDGGSWLGEETTFSSAELDLVAPGVVALVGQDGYEGLTAYAVIDDTQQPPTISGVVFPTAMPGVPEPYDAELTSTTG